MSRVRYHIVFNPMSGGGSTAHQYSRIVDGIRNALGAPQSICIVRDAHDAESSTRQALIEGAEMIVAVGGDGTIQDTARGFFLDGVAIGPSARLGIISTGTGRGFAESLGITSPIEEQIRVIAAGRTTAVDLFAITPHVQGSVTESATSSSNVRCEICVNECQFGIGGRVVRRTTGVIKKLGGRLAFGLITLVCTLTQRAHAFAISIDKARGENLQLLGVVVANGPLMGGGMQLVPGADARDGMLTVLLIHAMPLTERLRALPRIYKGTHVDGHRFSLRTCREIIVDGGERIDVAADGEQLASGARRICVMPSAINLITPGH